MKELVEHHTEEEEGEIFLMPQRTFDEGRRDEMSERFEELCDRKE